MTMNKVEVEELIGVLEDIRAQKYPDIPQELIRKIVAAQFEGQDDRAQARKTTKKHIDEYLKTVYSG